MITIIWRRSGISFLQMRLKPEWDIHLVQCLQCWSAVPICSDKKRADLKLKVLVLSFDLGSFIHLQTQTLASDQKNKNSETSDQKEFPLQGLWAFPWRLSENVWFIWEGLRVEALVLHIERSLMRGFWLGFLLDGSLVRCSGQRSSRRGRPRQSWRDYVSRFSFGLINF